MSFEAPERARSEGELTRSGVEAPAAEPTEAPVAAAARPRTLPAVTLAAAVVSALATFAATVRWLVPDPGHKIRQWSETRGHNAHRRGPLAKALGQAPRRMLRPAPELPHLVIDVKFRHMQKIYGKRSEALESGILTAGGDDLVPASIRVAERTIPVRLRLKGDALEHLRGHKWSFRIEVRGQDQILGLRRFSIQHPVVRGYQGEVLIFETMRLFGVITPRYSFAEVTVNGSSMGTMAIEEHFSRELLEANQRPDGVLLRLDETLVWAARDGRLFGFGGTYDDYRNAAIRPFRATRVAGSEKLSREYALATGLLRGFLDGTLRPSEVFDVEVMGRFLAVAELWGSWHAVRWHNVRFYLNPITARLEPVVFDAEIQKRESPRAISQNEPWTAAVLADPVVFAAYKSSIERLTAEVLEGDLLQRLQAAEQRHLRALQKEFFLLQAFDLRELAWRADLLRARSREQLETAHVPIQDYPVVIHASLVADAEPPYVELASAVPHEVEVRSLGWGADANQSGVALEPLSELELPVRLPARVWRRPYESLRIPYRPPAQEAGSSLGVVVRVPGVEGMWVVAAKPAVAALSRRPIPATPLDVDVSGAGVRRPEEARR